MPSRTVLALATIVAATLAAGACRPAEPGPAPTHTAPIPSPWVSPTGPPGRPVALHALWQRPMAWPYHDGFPDLPVGRLVTGGIVAALFDRDGSPTAVLVFVDARTGRVTARRTFPSAGPGADLLFPVSGRNGTPLIGVAWSGSTMRRVYDVHGREVWHTDRHTDRDDTTYVGGYVAELRDLRPSERGRARFTVSDRPGHIVASHDLLAFAEQWWGDDASVVAVRPGLLAVRGQAFGPHRLALLDLTGHGAPRWTWLRRPSQPAHTDPLRLGRIVAASGHLYAAWWHDVRGREEDVLARYDPGRATPVWHTVTGPVWQTTPGPVSGFDVLGDVVLDIAADDARTVHLLDAGTGRRIGPAAGWSAPDKDAFAYDYAYASGRLYLTESDVTHVINVRTGTLTCTIGASVVGATAKGDLVTSAPNVGGPYPETLRAYRVTG